MSNDARETILALRECFRAWDGDVRVLGNVRASDAVQAIDALLQRGAVPRGEPMMFRNIDRLPAAHCPVIVDTEAHVSADNVLGLELERIGALCSAKRRSVWVAFHPHEGRESDLAGYLTTSDTVAWIEIHGGREGDDFCMIIDETNPQYDELVSLFSLLRWCVQS